MSLTPVQVNTKEVSFSPFKSSFRADYASGVSAITVYSISNFAINQILLFGEHGNEGSEIVKTHAATAPTGFTVTLAAATTKPHAKDTPIYIISFDQIEFSHADTLAGAKTVLGSVQDINPEDDEMQYDDTTNTAGYYFTRYYNSITGIFSDYSDGIPYNGLPINTVGYAIDTAMNELHVKFSERLTFGMMIGFAKQMLKLVRGKLRYWKNYKEYDQNFGTLSQGVAKYVMPAEVYDQNSDKSVLNLRVGNSVPLTPISKDEYLQYTEDSTYTEVATQATAGQTSLVLDDTSDLGDTGAVDVFVSGTKYTIEYTVNTKSTNTLTVAADQITVTLPVDSPTWQNIQEGEPERFCVMDGYIYLWPVISDGFEGKNLTGDYLTDIETIDSQMDVLIGEKSDMLMPYLKFKIRAILENSGKEDLKDPSYQEFRELLQDAIKFGGDGEIRSFHPRGRVFSGGRDHLNRR